MHLFSRVKRGKKNCGERQANLKQDAVMNDIMEDITRQMIEGSSDKRTFINSMFKNGDDQVAKCETLIQYHLDGANECICGSHKYRKIYYLDGKRLSKTNYERLMNLRAFA